MKVNLRCYYNYVWVGTSIIVIIYSLLCETVCSLIESTPLMKKGIEAANSNRAYTTFGYMRNIVLICLFISYFVTILLQFFTWHHFITLFVIRYLSSPFFWPQVRFWHCYLAWVGLSSCLVFSHFSGKHAYIWQKFFRLLGFL